MAISESDREGRSAHAEDAKSGAEGAKNGVPWRTAAAIATAVLVLAAAHFWRDGSKGFGPGLLGETARLHWPKAPVAVTPGMPLNGVQEASPESGKQGVQGPGVPPPVSPYFLDDAQALDPFFAELWRLEKSGQVVLPAASARPLPEGAAAVSKPMSANADQGHPDVAVTSPGPPLPPDVVTILHYGDSPTTADLITGDARELLQARFGDAGPGFNLAAKPWAWYGHRGVEIEASGWKSSQAEATGVGRMRQGSYGLGGAVFAGEAGAKTSYKLSGEGITAVDVQFLSDPDSGTLTVSAGGANGSVLATINTRAVHGAAAQTVALPVGTKQVTIAVTSGTVQMFGVDLRRGARGVIYDSLGLNGATTTVISRTFDPDLWAEELHHTVPSLIVINYGTNESQFGGLVQTLDKELRAAIARARTAYPGVPVLIMSPMDRGERGGMSEIHTMAAIPQIVAIQQKVAAEERVGFFNTYAAMGGDGTMARWYAAKPRLVTADFIHPTPQGARLVAGLMIENLYAGYDRWKRLHGIALVPNVAATEPVLTRANQSKRQDEAAAPPKTEAKP